MEQFMNYFFKFDEKSVNSNQKVMLSFINSVKGHFQDADLMNAIQMEDEKERKKLQT